MIVHLLPPRKYQMAHHYYAGDGDKFDAQAMRDEAEKRAFDHHGPNDSVIHHHPHNSNGVCPDDAKHEYYEVGKGKLG